MKETKAADFGELSSENKHYFEFSYFSGDKTMSFMGLDTEEKFINSDFDWSIPSATMQVPACGFIHPGGGLYLEGDGQDAILRTTDYANASTNWVCYLRNNWQFGLISSSRKKRLRRPKRGSRALRRLLSKRRQALLTGIERLPAGSPIR